MQNKNNLMQNMKTGPGIRKPAASGGRLLKWKGKVASIAPSLLVCSLGIIGVIGATTGISSARTISTPETAPIAINTDEDVIITPAGSVIVSGLVESAIAIAEFASNFINRGEISTTFSTDSDVFGAGIRIFGNVNAPGHFENHGTVRTTATDTEDDLEIQIRGFWFNQGMMANLINNGQITINANTGGYVEADAIAIEGDVHGNVTNTNIVTTRVKGNTSAAATGFNLSNMLNGNFENSGTITVDVNSPEAVAGADGVYMGQQVVGAISNTGTIDARATAQTRAAARGYQLVTGLTGDFSNSGTITVNADSREKTAEATGVRMNENVTGQLVNSGIITVRATGKDKVTVDGMHTGDTFDGIFQNTKSGTISVNAVSSGNNAEVRGVYIDDNADNTYGMGNTSTIINAGNIIAHADAEKKASATGYRFSGDLEDHFANTGNITVGAINRNENTGTSNGANTVADRMAKASGVGFSGSMTGNISGSGNITVTATGANAATANGLFVEQALDGNFANNGNIAAHATSTASTADANGFHVKLEMSGDISNSGSITALANGTNTATANGLRLDNGLEGILENTGTISSTAKSSENRANANGVLVDKNMMADIMNAGNILADATANTSTDTGASARGYNLGGNLTGDFTNTGSITVRTKSEENNASSDGVHMGGPMSGDISNSGSITALANGTNTATANGLRLDNGLEGILENTGTISSTARSSENRANANGVLVDKNMMANIMNAGNILADATADTGASARGYNLGSNLTGDFTNTGSITVRTKSEESNASSDGVHMGGPMSGDISNSGTIAVTATGAGAGAATEAARAEGIRTNDTFNGTFLNTGIISAIATSSDIRAGSGEDGSARAGAVRFKGKATTNGIRNNGQVTARASSRTKAYARTYMFDNDLTGDFSNSGTITAMADGATGAIADGMYLKETLNGNLLNSGNMTVQASSTTNTTASGIQVGVQSDGTIDNTGMISASGTAPTGQVSGIHVRNAQGRIVNSGTIAVAASGGNRINSFGIYIKDHDGIISDVGRISAHSENGKAYAVFLEDGSGSLNVDTHDTIRNLMHVGAHDIELDARGRGDTSIFYFEDSAPNDGTFIKKVSDGRSVWFVDDEGGSKPVYAVVDPIDILSSRDVIADFGDTIGGIADPAKLQSRNKDANIPDWIAQRFKLNSFGRFASVSTKTENFRILRDIKAGLRTHDGNVGVTGTTDGGALFAVGMGIFHAEGNTPQTRTSTNALYLNGTYGRKIGMFDFTAGLGLGWLSNEKTRRVTGSSNASAEYDSTLLTAHAGVKKALDINLDAEINGFGNIRYTRQTDKAYMEQGSFVNARVGKAVAEILETTAGIEIEKQLPNKVGTLSGEISGVFRTSLSDPGARVRVLSTTETLSLVNADFVGANLHLGYKKEIMPGMFLDFSAEREIGTGAEGPNARAMINWSF